MKKVLLLIILVISTNIQGTWLNDYNTKLQENNRINNVNDKTNKEVKERKETGSISLISTSIVGINNIKIQWEWNGDDTVFSIYRNTKIIGDPFILAKSIKVGETSEKEFYDNDLSEGSYFYAVLLKSHEANPTKKDLIPWQSITYYGVDIGEVYPPDPVENIQAIIEDVVNIKLTWKLHKSENVLEYNKEPEYLIYRSNKILDSYSKVKYISPIRILSSSPYVDKNLADGSYYYAIVTRNSMNKVNTNFQSDMNFTSKPLIINHLPGIVSNIQASLINDKDISITWKNPEFYKDYSLLLYRLNNIGSSIEILNSDTKNLIKEISKREEFIDKGLEPGKYYYAILIRTDNITNHSLIENENYTLLPTEIKNTKLSLHVLELNAKAISNRIKLNWKNPNLKPPFELKLYRSTNVINNPDRLKNAKFIKELVSEENSYNDILTTYGRYYYAITISHNNLTNRNLYRNDNFTEKPVEYKQTKLDEHVKDISVSLKENNVSITWKNPELAGNFNLYLYRNTDIINSLEKLNRSKFIKKFTTHENSFNDKLVDYGEYYYAITLSQDGLTNKGLYKNDNYTYLPVKYKKTRLAAHVLDIGANLIDKKVELMWKNPNLKEGFSLMIYRHKNIIDSYDALKKASLIKEIISGESKYYDELPRYGEYYYAITMSQNGLTNNGLYIHDNYTSEPVIYKRKMLEEHVKDLKASIKDNYVELRWKNPKLNGGFKIKLYRNYSEINNQSVLKNAELIKEFTGDVKTYRDSLPGYGKYYYALTLSYNGLTNKNLYREDNYTSEPLVYSEKIYIPMNISFSTNNQSITLKWSKPKEADRFKILVYRDTKILNSMNKCTDNKLVKELIGSTEIYKDINLKENRTYFYALVSKSIKTGQKSNKFILNDNITDGIFINRKKKIEEPVIIIKEVEVQKRDIGDIRDLFEETMVIFYSEKNYKKVILNLKKIIKMDKHNTEFSRLSTLFIGKSLFYLKKYKKALDYFLKIRIFYPKETDFWIKKCYRKT